MTKREMIDQITLLNPTAKPAFLAPFADEELAEYLRHLRWLAVPGRPAGAGWAPRPGRTAPARPDRPGRAGVAAAVPPTRASSAEGPAPPAPPDQPAGTAAPVLLPEGAESSRPSVQAVALAGAPELTTPASQDTPSSAADEENVPPFAEASFPEDSQVWLF